MDPLLAGLVANLASAAIGRASRSAWSSVRFKRKRAVRAAEAGSVAAVPLLDVPDTVVPLIADYLTSGEARAAMSLLARATLAGDDHKYSADLIETARQTVSESLSWHLEEHANAEIASGVVHAMLAEIGGRLRSIGAHEVALSAPAEAELAKTAAAVAAASPAKLLQQLGVGRRAEYLSYASQYRSLLAVKFANMSLPHAGTTRRVPYSQLFVEPFVQPADEADVLAESRDLPAVTVASLLANTQRVVVLGNPGGGKSTLSQKLVFDVASTDNAQSADVPFLVVLRDYAPFISGRSRQSIVEFLELCSKNPIALDPPAGAIDYLLSTGRGLVIFDGLDELLDPSLRKKVVDAVEGFATRYPLTQVVVTSRRVGYEAAPLDSDLFPVGVLNEFTSDQVERYAANWFALDETIEVERRDLLTESFVRDSEFVHDLRVNPLLLALMCGIYATERYIPKNRPDVYEKCANLLLDQWDKQRGIAAPLPFEAHLQRAMRAMALHMFRAPGTQSVMSRSDLVKFMTVYLHEKRFKDRDEAEFAANQFLDFCRGRAWVLTEVGSELYSFTHRTFLEYFAASQLVLQHTSARELYGELREDIAQGGGAVVHQLAVQILGKTTDDGAEDLFKLVLADVREDLASSGESAANRTYFLLSSLSFLVPHPALIDELADVIVQVLTSVWVDDLDVRVVRRIAWELPLVASENVAAVQSALTSSMRAREGSDDEMRVFALAAHLNVRTSSPVGEHALDNWLEWARTSREYALARVRPRWREALWLAAELVEQMDVPLADFLDAHGLGALFRQDPSLASYENVYPLALVPLAGSIETRSSEWYTDEIADALAKFALARPFLVGVDPDALATWAGPVLGSEVYSLQRALPLALPIVEALSMQPQPEREFSRRRSGRMPDWVSDLLSARKGALLLVSQELAAIVATDSATADLVQKWANGSISFFGDGPFDDALTIRFA